MQRMAFITNGGSEKNKKKLFVIQCLKSLSGDRTTLVVISVTIKTFPGLQIKPLQIVLKDGGEMIMTAQSF